jgi:PAS domain S-box-containing protein
VIFLADGDDLRRKVEAIERGGIDFIARPLEAIEVLAKIKRHVTVSRVRRALQESEAKFRAVTESAIDAIVSADARGRILSWNQAATKMLGYTDAEMLGQPLTRMIPERFREAHNAGVERVGGGGPGKLIGNTVEVAALRTDGTEVPVELSLAMWSLDGERYFTGILRDISERKEAERKYRSVTDSAIDAIVSADHHGNIVGWNPAAERLFGWTSEQAAGQSLCMIIPERFREAHQRGIDRLTATGEAKVIGKTVELAALRADGSEFPIELSLSTWMVEDRRYFTGIIRDISERKEAEAKLKQYADELARQRDELQRRHDELQRSRAQLESSFKQAQKLFSAMTDGMPGAVLNGKYRLERKIAAGGFGVVYEATQLALERRVAVKLLRPPAHEDEETVLARFRREGITTCRIRHSNAVGILDLDITEGGFPYIAMEYLEGETLGDVIKRRTRLAPSIACRIVAEVCSAIAASHRAGVMHRDIKPSNVFLCGGESVLASHQLEGKIKVLDFGIAKLMDEPGLSSVTRSGHFVGTPSYMAPERLHSGARESDVSDVYSLGVLLYQALAGELPIPPRETLVQTIQAHLEGHGVPLSSVRPGIHPRLDDLVARCLHADPVKRPSASQMEVELRDLVAEELGDHTGEPDSGADGAPADEAPTWTGDSPTLRKGNAG